MAHSTETLNSLAPLDVSFNRPRPHWQHELFDKTATEAFDRIRKAIGCGSTCFTTTPPTTLHADLTTIHSAATANSALINNLARRQVHLRQESRVEFSMKATLQSEVARLEQCLLIHKREISNMGIREEIRQVQLRDLKDLELVMLVQALRDETPEGDGGAGERGGRGCDGTKEEEQTCHGRNQAG